MTMTALQLRSYERYSVGDRVIDHGNVANVIAEVDYNPHRCAGVGMCGRRDCGRYCLANAPQRPVRACSLRRMLAEGGEIEHRVGDYLIRVQCVRLDQAYAVTVWHVAGPVPIRLVEHDAPSWPCEVAARDCARLKAQLLLRETL